MTRTANLSMERESLMYGNGQRGKRKDEQRDMSYECSVRMKSCLVNIHQFARLIQNLDQDKLYTSRLSDMFVLKLGESDEKRVAGNGLKTKVVETSVDFDYLEIFLVLISGKEETETTLSPAMDVLIQVLKRVNGFRVLDVNDVTFLQIQPTPDETERREGFKLSYPLLLVVASEETRLSGPSSDNERDESQMENSMYSPTAVRFYSFKVTQLCSRPEISVNCVYGLCSPWIVAVGLGLQIYCFDALTLENKFSVLTYPISQMGGQGLFGVNMCYGPMSVGPRWLAYASNNPLLRLSSQNLTLSRCKSFNFTQ
ncbi:Breast carcinoma amplified sequence 3 [Artemisia annua]|uniref:Breast carcinoma amplified sequence 3 n=1 Tax=Artemisia annua TaxID=35608 RepID=A0A2U1MI59_ARTAN|nr:Breast carcinoma amplified sequence 3 [Artemisia annua]